MPLRFRFKHGVEQRHDGEDLLLADQQGRALRLKAPSQSLATMLQRLGEGGGTLLALMQGTSSLAPFITLQKMEQRGWLALELVRGEESLVTLEPQTMVLERSHSPDGAVGVRWSRFVQITPEPDGVLLEVPLRGARLSLQHSGLSPLIWELAGGCNWPTALQLLPQEFQEQGDDLLMLLLTAGVAGVVEADGTPSCDRQADQQRWSREDLSLHHRSRAGWTGQTLGGTFPGAVCGPAPPLLHQGRGGEAVPLPRPQPDAPEPGFFSVLEQRRSHRRPGMQELRLQQLGSLLWTSLRIREVFPAKPGVTNSYEAASRPVACGGAMHEIDTYLLIRRCDGVAPGLYRYDPLEHQLMHLDALNPACEQLLQNACHSSVAEQPPDVLFQFAARYGRLSWKYEGLVYALILKHVGVIMQQLYLVATALNLAPCSLGVGDSELFARATSLDPLTDVCVGELMLSARSEED
jgi:SagB-type dehydrogenase family enzyme